MSFTTTTRPSPHRLSSPSTALTEQISIAAQEVAPRDMNLFHPDSSPSKPRSLSDAPKPTLSPSPAFQEPAHAVKDDTAFTSPRTPKRPNFPVRGLSLQMPRDVSSPTNNFATRVPASPKLDPSNTYGAPASMLPRRSRGLEFARACTNLHHSTLAESSPDSSPTIAGRGLQIPPRKSLGSNSVLDSPSNITSGMWSTTPHLERTLPSSSVSSINILESDNSSTTSSDEEPAVGDMDDPLLTTPHASKLSNNGISGVADSPGGGWMGNHFSPAAASLMSFQRARLRKGRSRHSSSSGNSSRPSPVPLSPPLMKSIEHSNGSCFQQGLTKKQVQSRRESLSLGTGDLHLSDSGDEDTKASDGKDASGNTTSTSSTQSPRGVIRRPVTRRSNLLPKTKTFARIRATLMEEAAPVENEAKREADVIHQVREGEPAIMSPTRQSSFQHEGMYSALDDDVVTSDTPSVAEALASSFSRHAEKHSDGLRFWNNFDQRHRTPPPSLLTSKSSSALSDDLSMDSTNASQAINAGIGIFTGQHQPGSRSRSRSSTPLASNAPTAGEAARKANNRKRGRDDDLDPSSFKRRAVSPGMSVQSSPVLPQSPGFNGDKTWGQMPPPKTGNDRGNSGGSGSSNKRVGLQGMVETNDSLMNMSIE